MADLVKEFWYKWFWADELERLELVQKLTGFRDDYNKASLLNSYLTDLEEFLEEFWRDFYNPALSE